MSNPSKYKSSPTQFRIQLFSNKKLVLGIPRLQSYGGECKVNKSFRPSRDYHRLASWEGLELEAKIASRNETENMAKIISKEANHEVSSSTMKEEIYSWGQVTSFCTPSSGSTCVFLLMPKNETDLLILRYSSSAHLEFDFSKVFLLKK